MLLGAIAFGMMACNDLSQLSGTQQLPAGTSDPSVYHTAAGAVALYEHVVAAFQASAGVDTASIGGEKTEGSAGVAVDFTMMSGLITDELQAGDLGCTDFTCQARDLLNDFIFIDARDIEKYDAQSSAGITAESELYGRLQGLRNEANLGIGALTAYAPDSSALRGHLYAIAGYAELMLADLFCSGIPLSTLNFAGATSYTYAPGSTTLGVYAAAVAQFDSAIALSADSARILNLARVGKGRALLALDSFPQAAQAVAIVPEGFRYQFFVNWGGENAAGSIGAIGGRASVADSQGVTGLPYITSHDPRIAAQVAGTNSYGVPQYVPLKYGGATPTIAPLTVADWIEARLIQAEAQLQPVSAPNGPWLTTLNNLRANMAAVIAATNGNDPAATVLSPLIDPGVGLSSANATTARVNLLFRERALWLYLTGHRQGDLRRLIRQYHYTVGQAYPIGPYPLLQIGTFGSDVTWPIPSTELVNPYYHGCFSREA